MTEQSNETFVWIFEVEDCNYWGRTPDTEPEDFSEYRFLDGDTAHTAEMAQRLLWEHECSHADMKGDPDYEDCGECGGEGCDNCDHEGGWQEDYSEFVQKHAHGKLVPYDPELHMAVKSDKPEHIKYAHEKAIADLERDIERDEFDIAKQQEELRQLGEQIAARKRKLTDRKLLLVKLENQ
tara:strand:- start:5920 stop:6462 length:543 start_codon:yes stop_codon:yes gene_type:complete